MNFVLDRNNGTAIAEGVGEQSKQEVDHGSGTICHLNKTELQ